MGTNPATLDQLDPRLAALAATPAPRWAPGATPSGDAPDAASAINVWQAYPDLNQLAGHVIAMEGPTQRNNPGNLKDPKTGTFRTFDTAQQGQQALVNQLQRWKSQNPNWTIEDFNRTYAPDEFNGGDNPDGTEAARNEYLYRMAGRTGAPTSPVDAGPAAQAAPPSPLGPLLNLPASLRTAPALPENIVQTNPADPSVRTVPSVVPNPLPFSRWSLTNQLPPTSAPGINPVPPRASYAQASTDSITGSPSIQNPSLTKLGKVLTLLRAMGIGAAVGSTQPTFGTGLLAANQFENQQAAERQALQQGAAQTALARMNLELAPQELALREAQLRAQTQMMPLQTQIMQAQALAANYKEDPNLGLIDLRTGQPISSAGLAPLTAQEAAVLGKNPGDRVPLKLKNTASEIANRGIRTAQAGGRELLIDDQGNTIRDLGPATQLAVLGATNPFAGMNVGVATGDAALEGMTPEQQTLVRKIANYDMNPEQFRANRNPKAYADLMAAVSAYDPTYDQTQYGVKSALRKSFTSGADAKNIQSLNMVAHHLDLLDKANEALNSGNVQLLNQIANAYNVKVAGKSPAVVFNAVKNAVAGELGTTFKGSSATDPEIASIGSTIDSSLAKSINRDVIRADVGLIEGRLKALEFKYEQGMGRPADFHIISPDAEGIFNRLGGTPGRNRSPNLNAPAGNAPQGTVPSVSF